MEEVKSGFVTEVDKYNYVGFWVNKQGNCQLQIQEKKAKIKGEVVALKSTASYQNVGETFVNVRLELYESCIIPSLLFDMEAWSKQTKGEIKRLEQIQAKTLCTLLELPKSTPYIGLLNEIGIWRIEERLMYRKLMFYNYIMNSDDRRVAKGILTDQEENHDVDDSFYGTVAEMAKTIGVTLDDLKNLTKSKLKNVIKSRLDERMEHVINLTIPKMTKLRFMKQPATFERKSYIKQLSGTESIQVLRVRLNMVVIYGNYHGDVTMKRTCEHCEEADDTTEHLIECPILHSSLSSSLISQSCSTETWKQILEMVNFNMNHRAETCSWTRKQTIKWKDFEV